MTRRRRLLVAAGGGLVLVAVIVVVIVVVALTRGGREHHPVAPLTIGFGGGEGDSSCLDHPSDHTVVAKVRFEGRAAHHERVTVTITAYADENTSVPVGSASRTVDVEGTMHEQVLVTVPVTKPPFVGEDDITACGIEVKHVRV